MITLSKLRLTIFNEAKYLLQLVLFIFALNLLTLGSFASENGSGSTNNSEDVPTATFGFTYIGDLLYNFKGGIKTGGAYLGFMDINALFNTEHLNLWSGGEFLVNIQNTHMDCPSSNLIGDIQVVSNIENGDYTYLYQLWYRQQLGRFSFLAGLHDLNSEFYTSDLAGEFINSSFGIMPIVPANAPVSIFPKTTLAFLFSHRISNELFIQGGFYNGNPGNLDSDPYNLKHSLSFDDGIFNVGEVHYNFKNGIVKLGGFYHTGNFADVCDTMKCYDGNYGLHAMADYSFYNINDRQIGAFLQVGYSPKEKSINPLYFSLGLNVYAPFISRPNDFFGVAIANANISKTLVNAIPEVLAHETAIEITYKASINDHIIIQPDLQYIINPGADVGLSNAMVGIIRTYIEF